MTGPGLHAVRVVGGLVPPGLFGRLQAGQARDAESLTPRSYHLPGRETVRDAANRSWTYLWAAWLHWREHTAAQPPGSAGTGAARERWLLVLLRELGYGQLPALRGGVKVDGVEFPLSHIWQHVPVHLLGPGVALDRRNPGVAGAARAPQAMVQELLNRSPGHPWALLSNGLHLRLLRDSTALAGSAYLEFDLEAIFDGELFGEFLLLWQLCHVSRLEKRGGSDASPADCWLEAWRDEAVDAGTRALRDLSKQVQKALGALGTGFLRHRDNAWLVEALRCGVLSAESYHRALLRLVYRLLFLSVAEDRDVLLDPGTSPQRREHYARYFSIGRLRRLSRIRAGGPHGDLWQSLQVVLRALGGDGLKQLGIPALAGLFDPADESLDGAGGKTDHLLACSLGNTDLLTAMRALGWIAIRGQRVQPVDYRNLGAEELGSVYESLLELVPRLDLAERIFALEQVTGNERKTTGSYYTPVPLVNALLDSALDPLLDDAVKNAVDADDAVRQLLQITVCDPACGSGHFLVAAARRIARRVAQLRSGDEEPTPHEVQHALREVVGHCIYGVDVNPLAAELATVSLWLETVEPGKPLGFLDARIRVGNSLLGTTPALIAGEVPDEAFKEIEGDDKKLAGAVRKRNKRERAGQDQLDLFAPLLSNAKLAKEREPFLDLTDDPDKVREQGRAWEGYHTSADDLTRQRDQANAWCAAFVWKLAPGEPEPPTAAVVRRLGSPSDSIPGGVRTEVARLAAEYRFFHWHLEFPEIFTVTGDSPDVGPEGWSGGFHCLLGNPPWERVKLQEQEFFAARDPEIARAPNKAARQRLIKELRTGDSDAGRTLHQDYLDAKRHAEGESVLLRNTGRFPLTGRGDVNTYAVFAETFRTLTGPYGRSGAIVPTGIATDATTQHFFRDLVECRSLASLYDFENAAPIFEGVHRSFKFCLLTLNGRRETEPAAHFAFFLHDPALIETASFSLTPEEITLLNPNTGTCPVFRTRRDAEITLGIYQRVPVLVKEGDPDGNPWGVTFTTMFHMSNDSHLFHAREDLEADGWYLDGNVFIYGKKRMVPLYQAMMTDFFDHRNADVTRSPTAKQRPQQPSYLSDDDHLDPMRVALPLYWIDEIDLDPVLPEWLAGYSDITGPANERTLVPSIIPTAAVANAFPILDTNLAGEYKAAFISCLSSFVVDFCARQKFGRTSLNFFFVRQFPVLSPSAFEGAAPWDYQQSIPAWVRDRIVELSFNAWDMLPFAHDLQEQGAPFRWDRARRMLLRAELDAAFFHLYGVNGEDTDYILDTFPIVKRKDEAEYGEYRTKRLILEVYDRIAEAIRTGAPYQTILDPPPGQGLRHPAKQVVDEA
ncbi:MAG: Eco57I restriction-modification methylase domain-containing protein [Pseudonocardiaceae bacterium]